MSKVKTREQEDLSFVKTMAFQIFCSIRWDETKVVSTSKKSVEITKIFENNKVCLIKYSLEQDFLVPLIKPILGVNNVSLFNEKKQGFYSQNSTVNPRFKKVHFFFLKSRVVWCKKNLCSKSKNGRQRKLPYVGEFASLDLS